MPHLFKRIIALFEANKNAEALEIQNDVNGMLDIYNKINGIAAIKYAMNKAGIDGGECRNKFVGLTETNKAEIMNATDKIFEKYQL